MSNPASRYAPGMAGLTEQAKHRLRYQHEGLDTPEFLSTPWVQPSRDKAKEARRQDMYRSGAAPLCTPMVELDTMGIGLGLYFRLVKYLAVTFFVMSLFSIPSIVICRSGNGVADEDIDPLFLNLFSLANIGNPDELCSSSTAAAAADILTYSAADCNSTEIDVLGYKIEETDASLIISLSDLAYSIFFLVFLWFWRRRVKFVTRSIEKDVITVADYAVMVENLPRNATFKDIHDHFNGLYDLSKPDWVFSGYCCCISRKSKRRLTDDERLKASMQQNAAYRHVATDLRGHVIDNFPVYNVSNTRDSRYQGSWIAEIALAHPNGALIRKYQDQKKRLAEIRIAKATMKRYNPRGTYPSPTRFDKAQRKLDQLNRSLDKFDEKYAAKLSKECVGAFVVFNNEDSVRHCVADYERSVYRCGRWKQAKPLRYKGRIPLIVTPAPEPSDIIWENLEIDKFWRTMAVYGLMFLLLVVSIVFMSLAQNKKVEFQNKVPDLDVCDLELPAVAYGGYNKIPPGAELVHVEANDTLCGADSFYVTYQPENAIIFSGDWGCDSTQLPAETRCVDVDSEVVCTALNGRKFTRNSVVGCFCLQRLDNLIDDRGVFSGGRKMLEEDVCVDFALNYLLAQSLLLVAAFMVVFINTVLKVVLRRLTKFERQNSYTNEQLSVAIKVFIAQFLNTGLIILLVNANLSTSIPDEVGLFSGEFKSFEPRWYAVVGTSIVITMLVNVIAPHLLPAFHAIRACCSRSKKRFQSLVTQEQADRLYEPRKFQLDTRLPVILNTVFVSMAYSSGMPILLPIGFLSLFITYWLDKFVLLRLYGRPPAMRDLLAQFSIKVLPWALLLHLGISIWMYGDPDTLRSDPVTFGNDEWEERYSKWVEGDASEFDNVELVPKLLRANVFPLAALVFLIIFSKIGWLLVGKPVKAIIRTILYYAFCCCCCSHKKPPPKHHHPRYTAPFVLRLQPGEVLELSPAEIAAGWEVSVDPQRGDRFRVLSKVWTTDGVHHGVRHRRGEKMLTWQVVDEDTIPTYKIVANPIYTPIITALVEGARKVRLNASVSEDTRSLQQPSAGNGNHALPASAWNSGQLPNVDSSWLSTPQANNARAHPAQSGGIYSPSFIEGKEQEMVALTLAGSQGSQASHQNQTNGIGGPGAGPPLTPSGVGVGTLGGFHRIPEHPPESQSSDVNVYDPEYVAAMEALAAAEHGMAGPNADPMAVESISEGPSSAAGTFPPRSRALGPPPTTSAHSSPLLPPGSAGTPTLPPYDRAAAAGYTDSSGAYTAGGNNMYAGTHPTPPGTPEERTPYIT